MRERPNANLILATLSVAILAIATQSSMVVPAIPAFRRELHTSVEWSTWLLTMFMLVAAVATPLATSLGDRHGRAKVLVRALAIFVVGSIGCACAWDIGSLIGFRAVQGLGASVVPLSLAIVKDEMPPERVPVALAFIAGLGGGGGAVGIMLSGVIVDHTSWRLLFVVGGAVVAVATVCAARLGLHGGTRASGPPDVLGAVLLSSGLVALLLALTEGNRWGWGSPRILFLIAAAGTLLVVWARVELHVPHPLVDMRMLANRTVLLTNSAMFALGFTIFGIFFLLPVFTEETHRLLLGYGFGASATEAGLYLIPASLGLVLLAPLGGHVGRSLGGKPPLVFGMTMTGLAGLSLAHWHDTSAEVVLGMTLLGIGIAFGFAASPKLITDSVRPTETGVAMGMNQVMRSIGAVVGGQVAAALLTAETVGAGGLPAESAFTTAFWLCGALGLAGACCALLLGGRERLSAATSRSVPPG